MMAGSQRSAATAARIATRAACALVVLALVGCAAPGGSLGSAPVTAPPQPTEPTTAAEPSAPDAPPPSTDKCEYSVHEDLPLQRCDEGELVKALQAELASELGIDLAVDGLFGRKTEAAVKRYQTAHGLDADGFVGPATWNALFGSELPAAGATRGISENWFGQSAAQAVAALREQGFVVIDYEVCSSSVAAGDVRQIAAGDGTIYVDKGGVTDMGKQLPIGSVIEVKVGNGTACGD